MIERAGQLFAANIRSNDLAFRYDASTIAILLGETAEKEAMLAIEKLRKIIADVRLPGKDGAQGQPAQFSAGVAEAVIRTEYDPIDVVTEIINRAEHARESGDGAGARESSGVRSAALAATAVA